MIKLSKTQANQFHFHQNLHLTKIESSKGIWKSSFFIIPKKREILQKNH